MLREFGTKKKRQLKIIRNSCQHRKTYTRCSKANVSWLTTDVLPTGQMVKGRVLFSFWISTFPFPPDRLNILLLERRPTAFFLLHYFLRCTPGMVWACLQTAVYFWAVSPLCSSSNCTWCARICSTVLLSALIAKEIWSLVNTESI